VADGLDHLEVERIRGLEAEGGDLDATYLLGLIAINGTAVSDPDGATAARTATIRWIDRGWQSTILRCVPYSE
jgi:hypothetical protein